MALGPEVDLFTWRLVVALVAMMVLLFGIIWTWIEGAAYGFHVIGRYIHGFTDSGIVLSSLWRDTGDRFFLFFAVSFLIEA